MDAPTTQCSGRSANTKRDMLEAFDSRNNKLYLCRRGEPPSCSTEIYVIDVTTRVVTNLSEQLRHLKPDFSLCARENTQASFKPLPSLSLPSFTFMTLNSSNYLILFGGEEFGSSDKRPLSELIFIDVDNLRWWREPVSGVQIMRRRSGAAMTAFNGKIFIFGGHNPADRTNVPVLNSLPSYSVLEFNNERGQGIAIRTDIPYPQDVIGKLTFKHALPVYNDKQIFLTPFIDRTINPTGTELTPDNLCFFDPNNFTFQLIRLPSNTAFPMASINVTGDRDRGTPEFEALALKPEPERCYDWLRQTFIDKADGQVIQTDIWNLYKDTFSSFESNIPPLLGPADVIKSVKNVFPGSIAHAPIPLDVYARFFMIKGIERRKLALNYTYHPYREPKPESVITGQSILVAGWKCGENGRRGIYELWKLSLFPDNKIVCLDMSDKLQRANFGVRHVVVVDGRVYLLSSADSFEITEDEKIRRVKGFELSIDS